MVPILRKAVCGAEGIRTPGLISAIDALSQLSYSPRPSREYRVIGSECQVNGPARTKALPHDKLRGIPRSQAGDGIRTHDILLGKQTLCQLSYTRTYSLSISLTSGASNRAGVEPARHDCAENAQSGGFDTTGEPV